LRYPGHEAIALACAVAAACAAAPPDAADDDSEPASTAKVDGTATPIPQGTLAYGTAQPLGFPDGDGGSLVYVDFELTGERARHARDPGRSRHAALRLSPERRRLGPLARARRRQRPGKLSKLSIALHAGAYRALGHPQGRHRRGARGDPRELQRYGLHAADPEAGAPRDARQNHADVFVGPTQWQSSITAAIDSATVSLDVQMYLFTVTAIADAITAAQDRGVAVRVLLDPDEPNGAVVDRLETAGVEVRFDPAAFAFAHAKYMIVDHARTVIMSGNFNAGAMSSERNYAIIDPRRRRMSPMSRRSSSPTGRPAPRRISAARASSCRRSTPAIRHPRARARRAAHASTSSRST